VGSIFINRFGWEGKMVLLLAFLLVLLFFGLGFALHFLWIVAVVLLVLWLVGFALGRGESAGSHRFYRW
jgi:hypothetical protein